MDEQQRMVVLKKRGGFTMAKVAKRRNRLAGLGYKIVIMHHVVERYSQRAGVSMNEARSTLRMKFKDSKLVHFRPDGTEVRKECSGSLNKRLTFLAQKSGHTLFVTTCYLQGREDDYWKNEGLVIEDGGRRNG